MNFPGLDPAWSLLHHATHTLGLTPTWSLEEARAGLARGEKVLVVATTALGDSLLTTPLLETLSSHLGPKRVSLLVKAPYADLYRGDPRIGHVFSVRGKYRWKNFRADLSADPHRIALLANMTEPDLVPYLWRCGVRGFLRYRSRWTHYPKWMANREMLRRPGEEGYATGHAVENNLAMAEALGLAAATHRLALPHLRSSEQRGSVVLIHPGASRANKRWPVENWARLADAIVEEFDCGILITGSLPEKPLAHALVDQMTARKKAAVVITRDVTTLPILALAQNEARIFISGDTGPYHLALAMECPTVTLFAPTDRGSSVEACGPHGVDLDRHRVVRTANLGDRVDTISFAQVWTEVRNLLGG